MQKNYTNYDKAKYNPKKAVKTFQDLEVYQKALEASVFAANVIIIPFEEKGRPAADVASALPASPPSPALGRDIAEKIILGFGICTMKIPHLIAEAHSQRFGSGTKCLDVLDEVMLQCNKAAVYLEQTRDICETGVEWEKFDELIKKYFYIRRKVLNLQRVWRKYIVAKTDE